MGLHPTALGAPFGTTDCPGRFLKHPLCPGIRDRDGPSADGYRSRQTDTTTLTGERRDGGDPRPAGWDRAQVRPKTATREPPTKEPRLPAAARPENIRPSGSTPPRQPNV